MAFITALMTVFALAIPLAGLAVAATPDNTFDLDVTPETDSNPTGTTHQLTATLGQACTDANGCEIDFEIESGPAVSVTADDGTNPRTTDADNSPTSPDMTCTVPDTGTTCTVDFTSSTAGTNIIRAWVDDDDDSATFDADQTEGRNEVTTPGSRTEPDDTDVVEKNWFGALPVAAALDCTPETADNPATGPDSAETYTCTLFNDNGAGGGTANNDIQEGGEQGIAGVPIDGENLNGANDPDDSSGDGTADYNNCGTTNANGVAQCTVNASESQAGNAEICFWADNDNDNQFTPSATGFENDPQTQNDGEDCNEESLGTTDSDVTDIVEKNWLAAGQAATLTLTPKNDQNIEGTSHTLTATVRDAFGSPVQGAPVDFQVFGRNNGKGCDDAVTNAQGQATCTYTDTGPDIAPGGAAQSDSIDAFVDNNPNNDNWDGNEPGDSAEKFWFNEEPTAATVTYDADAFEFGFWDCGGLGFEDTAQNTVGNVHIVCAHVEDADGDPIPGESVTFTSTGPGQFWTDADGDNDVDANELSNSVTTQTDGDGDAVTFLYSEEIGIQTVTATADGVSDSGTKEWTAELARNIDCTPASATNPPGTQHVVTCNVIDQFNNPVEGEPVDFTETGPGRIDSDATNVETDANGDVEVVVTTTPAEQGTQEITATLDNSDPAPNNDECEALANRNDPGDPPNTLPGAQEGNCSDTVEKEWTPTPKPECSDNVDNDGDGRTDFPADPDCTSSDDTSETGPTTVTHERTVKIKRVRHVDLPGRRNPALLIKGTVSANDGFTDCAKAVPVKVQLRAGGEWLTRKTDVTASNDGNGDGAYVWKVLIRDVPGMYRAVAPLFQINDTTANEVHSCLKAKDRAPHRHG